MPNCLALGSTASVASYSGPSRYDLPGNYHQHPHIPSIVDNPRSGQTRRKGESHPPLLIQGPASTQQVVAPCSARLACSFLRRDWKEGGCNVMMDDVWSGQRRAISWICTPLHRDVFLSNTSPFVAPRDHPPVPSAPLRTPPCLKPRPSWLAGQNA